MAPPRPTIAASSGAPPSAQRQMRTLVPHGSIDSPPSAPWSLCSTTLDVDIRSPLNKRDADSVASLLNALHSPQALGHIVELSLIHI